MNGLDVITFLVMSLGWWLLHDVALSLRPRRFSPRMWAVISLIIVFVIPLTLLAMVIWLR